MFLGAGSKNPTPVTPGKQKCQTNKAAGAALISIFYRLGLGFLFVFFILHTYLQPGFWGVQWVFQLNMPLYLPSFDTFCEME